MYLTGHKPQGVLINPGEITKGSIARYKLLPSPASIRSTLPS